MRLLIIHGVNLGLLGKREPEIYGTQTLEEINREIEKFANLRGAEVAFYQSDLEGDLCKKIGESCGYDGIILNAGAYSHYSYALRDAIAATDLPVVEVHMSNIAAREEFRSRSVLAPVCRGVVYGFQAKSYILAVESFLL